MIEQAIKNAITAETAKIVEDEAKAAAERVEKRVRGMVAEIAATVITRMSMERRGDQLVILMDFKPRQ